MTYVKQENARPIFLLAHSNGALVALDALRKNTALVDDVKGLIVTSPFLAVAGEISPVKVMVCKVLGTLLPSVRIPVDELESTVLTHCPQKQKELDEDKLCLDSATLGWAKQAMITQNEFLNSDKNIKVPLFFCFSGDDKVVDPDVNRKCAEECTSPDKTVLERKEEFHELLNEVDREELYGRIGEWIVERVAT